MLGGHLIELIPLVLVALIFLGPKRLPDAGKSLGQAIRGFREETKGFRDELAPLKDEVHNIHSEVTGVRDAVKASATAPVHVEPVATKSL